MIDTKAARALADKQANVWTPIGWEADVANMLRQCADEIDTLRAENAAISKSRWELGVQVGRLEIECDTLRAEVNEWRQSVCEHGDVIDQLMNERDTLRELVREALPYMKMYGHRLWRERAEKALEGK